MSVADETYYNLTRLHVVFAAAALALLAVTVWMLVADHRRPWKEYQRQYRLLAGQQPQTPVIEQVWLPELTINYNFRHVARSDRCTTCHQGIDKPLSKNSPLPLAGEGHNNLSPLPLGEGHNNLSPLPLGEGQGVRAVGLPQPYAPHPRLDLYVSATSPHPLAEFGCTVCHDGQGSATDFRWASHTPNDPAQRRRWRDELGWSAHPQGDFPMLARRFHQSRCLRCHPNVTDLESPPTDPAAAKLVAGYQLVRQYGCFGCHEIPQFRNVTHKVGPSLRNIAGKLRPEYLADRIRNPANFLPSTRMPRLYGLYEHLEGQTLADTRNAEEAEIAGIVDYLLASRPDGDWSIFRREDTFFEQAQAENMDLSPSAARGGQSHFRGENVGSGNIERGKRLFETQGCLACHRHADFPQGQATQGPDLSNVGKKYLVGTGADWLTGWLRDPARYSPQTLMPNPLLAPIPGGDGRTTDPAADLAAYLMGGGENEERRTKKEEVSLPNSSFLLPNSSSPAPLSLGRQAVAKRGCAGCHDIPGFESAPPIGPALGDWGRKSESLLAFEQIDEFVKNTEMGRQLNGRPNVALNGRPNSERLAADGTSALSPARTPGLNSDDGFFRDALLAHRREGFLWQKLCMPRSFDYKLAQAKPVDEQLKMGRFELTDAQREAIITFMLGLVDETPSPKYVYRPDRRRRAIIEGRKVLEKYACAECHALELEQWTLDDRTVLRGVPRLDLGGALQQDEDDDGQPIHFFTLWEPATFKGQAFPVGGADVVVPKSRLTAVRPPWGGTLARLLYPVVLRQARQSGSSAAEVEAWGWLPPSLVHEGAIVRPEWLYRYLLDPTVIRPASVLRMPRFNLSPAEARKLTDYFAAVAGAEYPYTARPTASSAPLDTARMDKAMRLLLDRKVYCAKCHLIGDYRPAGENRTLLAPRLDEVAGRLRPEYVRRWLADPKSVLPYTAMPAHFPSTGPPLGQDLFPGSSREQLDAVAELLIRYDEYMKERGILQIEKCKLKNAN